MTPRALIYVQHLLGIGHLARVNRIAASVVEAGIRTTIVQGGVGTGLAAVAGAETVQLTPVKVAATDMATLLHADGRLFADLDQRRRRDDLLALLRRVRPDILIVEAYPFGRRQMRFELVPLMEAAKTMGVPVIASSIRDILQENRKPGRDRETADMIHASFDLVLVHGEEDLTPLAMTFPLADEIAPKTRYTGLVGAGFPGVVHDGHAVVVSAGGGSVGIRLLEAAIAAAPLSRFRSDAWLILAGHNLPEKDFAGLQAKAAEAPGRLTVLRGVPDLPSHLAGARLSVSQAGYNTVADILVAGCAAVVVPFASGGETEQTVRAEALASAGRVVMLREVDLDPESLAAAIDAAADLPAAPPRQLDGGRRTATILLEALAQHAMSKGRVETGPAMLSSSSQERP